MNITELYDRTPSAWKANKELAQWLVHTFNPSIIVDLGVDYGYSSYVLAENPVGTVYAVDWFQGDQHAGYRDTYSYVTSAIAEFSLTNIKVIKADFTHLAKTWAAPIDILHIDGEHTYEAVSRDYANWFDHVEDDGIILFHDTVTFKDSVGVFFEELCIPKINFTEDNGLGIASRSQLIIDSITKYINRAV